MAKPTDLEGRFDAAMKKGEKQDKGKRTTSDGYMPKSAQTSHEAVKEWKKTGIKPKGLKKVDLNKAFPKV